MTSEAGEAAVLGGEAIVNPSLVDITSRTINYVRGIVGPSEQAVITLNTVLRDELDPLWAELHRWWTDPIAHRTAYDSTTSQFITPYIVELFYRFLTQTHFTLQQARKVVVHVVREPDETMEQAQQDPQLHPDITNEEMYAAASEQLKHRKHQLMCSRLAAERQLEAANHQAISQVQAALWARTETEIRSHVTYGSTVDAISDQQLLLRQYATSHDSPHLQWYAEALRRTADHLATVCVLCLRALKPEDEAVLCCPLKKPRRGQEQQQAERVLFPDPSRLLYANESVNMRHQFHEQCIRSLTMDQQLNEAHSRGRQRFLSNNAGMQFDVLEHKAQQAGVEAAAELEVKLRGQVCPAHFRPRTSVRSAHGQDLCTPPRAMIHAE